MSDAGDESILAVTFLHGFAVRNLAKGDHGVEGNKGLGRKVVEPAVEPLAGEEGLTEDQCAHFGVIVECEVTNGVGVWASAVGESGDRGAEVALMRIEEAGQDLAILETGIHALSVKGHHGVDRVAQQQNLVGIVVLVQLPKISCR